MEHRAGKIEHCTIVRIEILRRGIRTVHYRSDSKTFADGATVGGLAASAPDGWQKSFNNFLKLDRQTSCDAAQADLVRAFEMPTEVGLAATRLH